MQQRRDPDEGPVVGEVDAEPHQPERDRALTKTRAEQLPPTDALGFGTLETVLGLRGAGLTNTGLGVDSGSALPVIDDRLGLLMSALRLQEAHRFGHLRPDHQRPQRRDEAEGQRPTPAVLQRHDEVPDERGAEPTHGPERLERHHHTATDPLRRELTHQRRCHGQFTAKSKAHHEPQHDERHQSR